MGKIERAQMTKAHQARAAQRQQDKANYQKKVDNQKAQEDKAVERGINKAKAKGRAIKEKAKKALRPNHYDTKNHGDRNKMGLIDDLADRAKQTAKGVINDVKDANYKVARKVYKTGKAVVNLDMEIRKKEAQVLTSAKAEVKKAAKKVRTKAAQAYDDVATGVNKAVDKVGTFFGKIKQKWDES